MSMQPVRKPSLEAAPLGVRTIGFVVRHFGLLVISTVVFTVIGVATSFALPRPFVDRAMVELGMRFLDEPVEHPMVAGARLTGYLRTAAREAGIPDATIVVDLRRHQKSNAPTRLLEVRVEAPTAEQTRKIIDEAVARLIAEHGAIQKRELEILRRQLTQFEETAKRLDGALETETDEEQIEEIGPLIVAVHRTINATRSVATELRLPPTRVVRHALEPAPAPSRLPITTLAGVLLGAMVGVISGAWRDAKRSLA